jgi:UDP-N-acetylmuramate-alanine ligase
LLANIHSGDVVIVLSAGDANQISAKVVDKLSLNGNA